MSSIHDAPGERLRLFVGLDFGTTFTGIAWCLSSDPTINRIEVLTDWPGNQSSEKTPSEICYRDGKPPLWGFEADGSVGERSGSNPIYGRFKLRLDPLANETPINGQLARLSIVANNKATAYDLPPGKSAVEVSTDYLTPLYTFVMSVLRKRIGGDSKSVDLLDSTPIEWIITVPAIWDHKAQEATRTAAKKAGFGSRSIDITRMVSEPEAAALYTLKELQQGGDKITTIKVGEDFVVCDAGGGTVDLITYAIEQIEPVLKFSETVVGKGGKCGSTFIDEAFHAFLRRKIGKDFDNDKKWTPRRKGRGSALMKRWDVQKRSFGTEGSAETWYAPLPPGMTEDNKAMGILDDELEVTRNDMTSMFDPVVDQVIALVKEQVDKTRAAKPNGTIATVMLVGGFGESNYLYKRLKTWGGRQSPPLSIRNPANSWSAIVRGAVMYAIAPSVISRKLRMHYGLLVGTNFIKGRHDEEDAYTDPFHGKMTRDNVEWLANLGDDATEERKISFPVYVTFEPGESRNSVNALIMGCKFEEASSSVKGYKVQPVGIVPCDLSAVPRTYMTEKLHGGVMHTKCSFSVDMELASGEAIFSVNLDGTTYGRTYLSLDDMSSEVGI